MKKRNNKVYHELTEPPRFEHPEKRSIITNNMKLKPQPENPMEWMALRMNVVPTPLVDTQIAFSSARAIMAAAELGIYEALGKSERTAEQISAACKTNTHATKQLLNCLVGIGYLQWKNEKYALRPKYYKWLLQESETNMIGKLRFQLLEWNSEKGRTEKDIRINL